MVYQSGLQERFQRIEVMYQAISDGNMLNNIVLPNQDEPVKKVLEIIQKEGMILYAANISNPSRAFIIGVDDPTELQGHRLKRTLNDHDFTTINRRDLDAVVTEYGLNDLTLEKENKVALELREIEDRYKIRLGKESELNEAQLAEYQNAVEQYMDLFERRESQVFVPAIRDNIARHTNPGVVFITSTHHTLSANFLKELRKENFSSLFIVGNYSK